MCVRACVFFCTYGCMYANILCACLLSYYLIVSTDLTRSNCEFWQNFVIKFLANISCFFFSFTLEEWQPKAYLVLFQTYMMELFTKIVKRF